jgi:hypothetical protein
MVMISTHVQVFPSLPDQVQYGLLRLADLLICCLLSFVVEFLQKSHLIFSARSLLSPHRSLTARPLYEV